MKAPKRKDIEERQEWSDGYCWCYGALDAIGDRARKFAYIILVLAAIYTLSGAFIDDSDEGRFKRSGMRILTDHKTGQEYLSKGNSLIERRSNEDRQ